MKTKRGRPPKDAGDRKTVDLRIPVTADQKARIMEAVSLDETGMAEWARTILLSAADERLRRHARSLQ